ncbi:MAG: DUF5050 domain-containing protein, partial [Firmicutes bacterium]|nr:DUF5050 domain-containing protein [Bacillota bacterium]
MKRIISFILSLFVVWTGTISVLCDDIDNQSNKKHINGIYNNISNTINGGFVCSYGDYIYYINPDDSDGIYMKNQSINKKIYTGTVNYLCVGNGYLYFSKSTLDEASISAINLEDYSVKKIVSVDGEEGIMELYFVNDNLYFKTNNKIIEYDGLKQKTVFQNTKMYNYCINNDLIFYDYYNENNE